MRRYGQPGAGLVFGLTLAALILFWAVKDTKPSGSAVLPILYGVLAASALIWLIAEIGRRRDKDRESSEGLPLEKPVKMSLSLLNSIRLGEQLRDRQYTPEEWERWLTPVSGLLTEHAEQADAERFLEQRSLENQLSVLRELLENQR